MAVGAGRNDVLAMILKTALHHVSIGCAIGTLLSLGLTRFLENQLWGVSSSDPWTLIAAVAIIVTAGLAASITPALRGARVDPLVALRCE